MNKNQQQGRESRQRIYLFIREFKAEHRGLAPTIREICRGLGIPSTSTVGYHLEDLRAQLAIEGDIKTARCIQLPGEQYNLPAPVEIH